MCGIVGYIGYRQAAPILLEGLAKLEYRGYDSAGVAVQQKGGKPQVVKCKGRLQKLEEKLDGGKVLQGICGIGHTRWATHGEPSAKNAHPHQSEAGRVVGVHNGVIENYVELKEKLLKKGYTFESSTDTEVVIKLIDYYDRKHRKGPTDALTRTMVRIRGSYALAVLFRDHPEEIWVARKDSPLVIGEEKGECFVASDVSAILSYTRNVYYMGDLELARVRAGSVKFYSTDGSVLQKEKQWVDWELEAAERGGFPHFMMKEICEQPEAARNLLGSFHLSGLGISEQDLKELSQITIVACGSAYHAGVTVQYVMEDLAGIPVRVELASEFRYRRVIPDERGLVIVISQSGETADTLSALRKASDMGIRTLGIVNAVGSSIAREADAVLYTQAGLEIAVATTKAYASQLMAGYLLALEFGRIRGTLGSEKYEDLMKKLEELPSKIERILEEKEKWMHFAERHVHRRDVFFVGRGLDYSVAMEGSLKLKEVTYIHAEAFAAGELKHGTISLVEEGTLVIGVATDPELYEKTFGNLMEVKSRGAEVALLTMEGCGGNGELADQILTIPETDPHFTASLAVIPLQLMAYYWSAAKGLDVDKPRNLAKSVTVE